MSTEAYLKTELANLKINPAYRGRQSTSTLLIPNSSTLPAGAVRNGNDINITGTCDLADFDLSELRVLVGASGDLNSLTNCYHKVTLLNHADSDEGWLKNQAGGRIGLIEHNTFDGGDEDNPNGVIKGSFEILRSNFFLDIGRDYLKPDGNASLVPMLIEGNYFAEPRTFHNDASDWNSGSTYAIDDVVFFVSAKDGASAKYYPFWSKGNGNVGNSPPATWSSGNPDAASSDWFPKDPHVDMLQTGGTIKGPITVRWNHFAFRPNPRAGLFTAAIWFRPFAQQIINHQCDAYGNWLDATDNGSTVPYYARMMSCDDGGGGVKPRFYNNWAESGYKIYRGASAMLWGGNTRFDDSPVPLNDPDVLDTGNNSSEFTPPAARGTTFPAGGMLTLTGGAPTPSGKGLILVNGQGLSSTSGLLQI